MARRVRRNAANSSYARAAGADALNLERSRSVKGELAAAVALGSGRYLAVNAQTPAGCSLMVWEADNNARQRWCTRLWQGGGSSSPLFDGFDNLYVGQPGTMMSFPLTQWFRWRRPVIGMPTTPRILAPGHLLVVTHLGQVLLFDAQRGTVIGTPLDLVAGVDPFRLRAPGWPTAGLDGRAAPVASAPAFAASTGVVVINVRRPGAPGPVLVGLEVQPRAAPRAVAGLDQRSPVPGGVLAGPVASADGSAVYVDEPRRQAAGVGRRRSASRNGRHR